MGEETMKMRERELKCFLDKYSETVQRRQDASISHKGNDKGHLFLRGVAFRAPSYCSGTKVQTPLCLSTPDICGA
jgi:hypothetical protein